MTYEYQREGGERILVQNQDGQTSIHLHSRGMGQEQSQGSGFTTGAWNGKPRLYRSGEEWFLQLPISGDQRVITLSRHGVRQSGAEIPSGAGELPLREVEDSAVPAMKPMRPMAPMKPMEPMRPMTPMQPMTPL